MGTSASLKAFRDEMHSLYASNLINANSFVIKYVANMSKDIYSY